MPASKKSKPAGAPRKPAAKASPKQSSKPQLLAEKAYQELRALIMAGEFLPGDRLREEELVKRLGVSRTIVRHALVQLGSEGLVDDAPGRGKTVVTHSADSLAQLLPIRIALEQLALRLAMERFTDKDLAELKSIAGRLCHPGLDLAEQNALDIRLHQLIWKAADNEQLEQILHRVAGPFHMTAQAVMLSSIGRRSMAAASWQQILLEQERHAGGHQLLVETICAKNVPAAMKAIESHLTFNYETSPEDYNRKIAQLMRRYTPRSDA